MLAGYHLIDLPEARHSTPRGGTVDRWPLIFKDLEKHQYVTMFSDDDPQWGAFQFRLSGFNNQPTDKYLLPFFMASKDKWEWAHKYAFDYLREYSSTYHWYKTFAFLGMSQLGHSYLNRVHIADDDTLNILKYFAQDMFKNNTAIFLFGDHGSRNSDLRITIWGKLEERLPFMSITMPPWFRRKYPKEMGNLRMNSQVLTSHFDVYQTLRHLISFTNYKKSREIGESLFSNIAALNRTCMDAGTPKHFCPCLEFKSIFTNDRLVLNVAETVVRHINEMTNNITKAKQLCMQLGLKDIIRARKVEPNEDMQKHGGTYGNEKCDHCGIILDRKFKIQATQYEVVFSVEPSNGIYEATVEYLYDTKDIRVNSDISRVNRYGDQSNCIARDYPHLRKYCFCK